MNENRTEYDRLVTVSLVVIALVAVAGALAYTRVLMIPFVLAICIVSLASPIFDFQIIRLRFPHLLAVSVTLLFVLIIIAFICFMIGWGAQTIVRTIDSYSKDLGQLAEKGILKLDEWGLDLKEEKTAADIQRKIVNLATDTFSRAVGIISSLLFVIVFVLFLLAGRDPYAVRSGVSADIDQKIRRYVATKVAVSAVTGLLVWAALYAVGLKLASVFGMLAFVLNFIPSIGSIISTLLPIPIAAAQFQQNPWVVVYVVAVPGAVQMVIGNIIEPKLMGEGLNLHPVTILLALLFWGLLWGIGGMFLAAPVTAIIRIVLMQFETLQPIGKLMAGDLSGFRQSVQPDLPFDKTRTPSK